MLWKGKHPKDGGFLPRIKPENKNLKFVGQKINKLHKLDLSIQKNMKKTMVCVTMFAYQKFDSVQKCWYLRSSKTFCQKI